MIDKQDIAKIIEAHFNNSSNKSKNLAIKELFLYLQQSEGRLLLEASNIKINS